MGALNWSDIFLLASLPVLLVASGFFSGSETALFSLSRHQRLRLARSGSLAGATIATLLHETRALLITILLCNMTINVLYFVVSTVLMIRLQARGQIGGLTISLASVGTLLGVILFGEVFPKVIASRATEGFARVVSLPLLAVHRAIAPLRVFLSVAVVTPLARLLAPPAPPAELSSEEFATLLELSQHHGVIDREEETILQQVLELGQLKVRDLMTPRVDVVAFDLADEPAKLLETIRTSRRSRIPVFKGDIDHVEGVVLSRQVLLEQPTDSAGVARLVRQVTFVPELSRADTLLVQMRKTGNTMAITVDEYGGTAGVIALKDLVEHMVGQIPEVGEAAPPPQVQSVGPSDWRVSAELSIHEWSDAFGAVGGVTGVSTIGGLVMAQLGRVPRVGDSTELGNLRIEVEGMDGYRLTWLRIRLRDAHAAGRGGAR